MSSIRSWWSAPVATTSAPATKFRVAAKTAATLQGQFRPELPTRSTDVRSSQENNRPAKEVTIAVLGAVGSGKTSFINLVSGSKLEVGSGLESCTQTVQSSAPFRLDNCSVTLIDTPGFDDTLKSDTDVLKTIAAFLSTEYKHGKTLNGVIYMHRISDIRMSGVARRNFTMFRHLCGDSALQNIAIVTNMWGEVKEEVGQARQAQLASKDIFFKPVLDLKAKLIRNDNTVESARALLRQIVSNTPTTLQIQRELVDEHKDITQTAAGKELNRDLLAQTQRHHEEMRNLQNEMRDAIQAKDEETRKELEDKYVILQEEMSKVQAESQDLVSEYNEEKMRLERKMQEIDEEAKQRSSKVAQEHEEHVQSLQSRLAEMSLVSAERTELAQQLADLRAEREQTRRPELGVFGQFGITVDSWVGAINARLEGHANSRTYTDVVGKMGALLPTPAFTARLEQHTGSRSLKDLFSRALPPGPAVVDREGSRSRF